MGAATTAFAPGGKHPRAATGLKATESKRQTLNTVSILSVSIIIGNQLLRKQHTTA